MLTSQKKQHIPQCFNVIKKTLSDSSALYIIDLKEITPELETFINQQLTLIHSANEYDFERTKKILRKTFDTKDRSDVIHDVKMGAIAEFFIHLFFSYLDFKQECLFINLEEIHGIKKGHDGYYSFENESWIMESKSSRNSASHVENIKDAYKDISKKVSGKSTNKNNPWANALHHANAVKSNNDILKRIKKLSEDFIDGIFHDVSEFNIIPSSTVFFDGNWSQLDYEEIFRKIDNYVPNMNYKKMNVICITQKTVNLFLDYIDKK